MTSTFFTYFTSEFLAIGITSVLRYVKFNPHARGFVFCFGREAKTNIAECLTGPVKVIDILDVPFLNLKYSNLLKSRTRYEALISMKPILFEYVLNCAKENESVVYFDPDLMFFGEFQPLLKLNYDLQLFAQLGTAQNDEKLYGKFNAGLIILRNSSVGRSIAQAWSVLCEEWCQLVPEEDRFADQKYLERFLGRDTVIGHRLINVNLSTRAFSPTNYSLYGGLVLRKHKKEVWINHLGLIAFHFHGLRIIHTWIFTGFNRFGRIYGKRRLFKLVYKPVLAEVAYWHRRNSCGFKYGQGKSIGDKPSQYALASLNMKFSAINTPIEVLRRTKLPISWL